MAELGKIISHWPRTK